MVRNVTDEQLPISQKLKVIESETLYKTDKWWAAVVLVDSFGRKQIAIYLWARKGDEWKRRQKFVIHDKGEWLQIKDAVEKLIDKLTA